MDDSFHWKCEVEKTNADVTKYHKFLACTKIVRKFLLTQIYTNEMEHIKREISRCSDVKQIESRKWER